MDKNKNDDNIYVSVIIPTKNEEYNIDDCLTAVFNQKSSYKFEVLVIDSGSRDQTLVKVRNYPEVKILQIKPEEFSHSRTRNLGAQISQGKYLLFLNADAVPANNEWLSMLTNEFKRKDRVAGVYSRHLPKPECHLYMKRDLLKSMPTKRIVKTSEKEFDYFIFSTVSCLIAREIWEKNLFADNILIAEDQVWAKNILKQGYKIVYQPMSMVYHSHNYSAKQLFQVKLAVSKSFKKYHSKFLNLTLGLILVSGGLTRKIIGDFVFIMTSRISFSAKLKELKISIRARLVSYLARYVGWITS